MLRCAVTVAAFWVACLPGFSFADDSSEYGVLVEKPGVEETYIYCAACHSERIVAQQGLKRKDWKELLQWMVNEQEMEVIEEPDYSIILDYLAENYNIDRPNFPRSK